VTKVGVKIRATLLQSKNRYSKKEVIESLENLINLCDRAEKENKIIEHRGI